jgi:hypothetical protein
VSSVAHLGTSAQFSPRTLPSRCEIFHWCSRWNDFVTPELRVRWRGSWTHSNSYAYIKLAQGAQLLQKAGEDQLAEEAEALAGKVERAEAAARIRALDLNKPTRRT